MFLKIVSKNLILLNKIILSKIDIFEIKIDVQLIFKRASREFFKGAQKIFRLWRNQCSGCAGLAFGERP